MKLQLDLSPTLINQTAMAYISNDIAVALEGLDVRHSYFGQVRDTRPVGQDVDRLRSNLDELLAAASRGRRFLSQAVSRSRSRDADRIVFLDPLYTLFSELDENDIVLVLDMSVVTSPHWHNPHVVSLYQEAFSRIAAAQPRLLAISHNTADSYHANYGYPRREIEVTPLYVPDHLKRPKESPPRLRGAKPYFLFVGSLEVRKNVAGAIMAFGRSGLAWQGYEFIVAGGRGHGAEVAEAAALRAPNVILTGRVSDQQLRDLYAGACGFIYPSFLEGFGVPLLEALQYGVPAVASVTGACPEVGGDLIVYCDPDHHSAIAGELIRIANMSATDRTAFAVRAQAHVLENFSKSKFQAAFHRSVSEI